MLLITLTMALFYSSFPVSRDSEPACTISEIRAAKWNSAISHFVIYTSAFPTVTHLNM